MLCISNFCALCAAKNPSLCRCELQKSWNFAGGREQQRVPDCLLLGGERGGDQEHCQAAGALSNLVCWQCCMKKQDQEQVISNQHCQKKFFHIQNFRWRWSKLRPRAGLGPGELFLSSFSSFLFWFISVLFICFFRAVSVEQHWSYGNLECAIL